MITFGALDREVEEPTSVERFGCRAQKSESLAVPIQAREIRFLYSDGPTKRKGLNILHRMAGEGTREQQTDRLKEIMLLGHRGIEEKRKSGVVRRAKQSTALGPKMLFAAGSMVCESDVAETGEHIAHARGLRGRGSGLRL